MSLFARPIHICTPSVAFRNASVEEQNRGRMRARSKPCAESALRILGGASFGLVLCHGYVVGSDSPQPLSPAEYRRACGPRWIILENNPAWPAYPSGRSECRRARRLFLRSLWLRAGVVSASKVN